MRIYIIGNDGITLCREAPATVSNGEFAVASKEELHAAPLSGKRLLALWNARPAARSSGYPCVVVACTKSTIACFAGPSFHEGSTCAEA